MDLELKLFYQNQGINSLVRIIESTPAWICQFAYNQRPRFVVSFNSF